MDLPPAKYLQLFSLSEVLERAIAGNLILDLGCCFGQDLRPLASDGAPTGNIYATVFSKELWHLGFELFNGHNKMKAKLIQANIFDVNDELERLKGTVDVIIANQFLHLFNWEGQLRAMKKIVELSKPQSMAVGYQRALVPRMEVERP